MSSMDMNAAEPAEEPEHASRKDEHLDLAVRLHGADCPNAFDDVSFMHHALPRTSADSIDISTSVCGARWRVPFYINAMTGGTSATAAINADLARAAADAGVAIACGSQHVACGSPSAQAASRSSAARRRTPSYWAMWVPPWHRSRRCGPWR